MIFILYETKKLISLKIQNQYLKRSARTHLKRVRCAKWLRRIEPRGHCPKSVQRDSNYLSGQAMPQGAVVQKIQDDL